MFNRDENGHPVPGAPEPHFISNEYHEVCSLCEGIHDHLGFCKDYWRDLHRTWAEAQKKRRDDDDRLTGRKDYFNG